MMIFRIAFPSVFNLQQFANFGRSVRAERWPGFPAAPLLTFAVTLFIILASQSAFALSLEEAKSKGLVGELRTGYLGSPSGSATGDVQALIQDVNQKRKQLYNSIAQKNGSPLVVVEQLAAKEAIEKSAGGAMIQSDEGKWVKK